MLKKIFNKSALTGGEVVFKKLIVVGDERLELPTPSVDDYSMISMT